jgi:hypothetical protein
MLRHGYGSFFPTPPELDVIQTSWPDLRRYLASLDLDIHTCYEPLSAFVPKSRLNVRYASLLHPFDLIIYTALVLELRDDISAARLPPRSKRVLSFRAEGADHNALYTSQPSYADFRRRLRAKGRARPQDFVGVSDIGDFYPRIYQHRLINALEAAITDPSKRDVIRVLEKLLTQLAGGASIGIPVGPPASRPLAEAVLIDVDSALVSRGIDFVRYVDDYVIFARSRELAEAGLAFLGETLFTNHRLTLQTAKTSVLGTPAYVQQYLTAHSKRERQRRDILRILIADASYPRSWEQLSTEEQAEVNSLNLAQMLEEALTPDTPVDFAEVSFILGRLSALQRPELIPLVLRNLERLYPVSHSVAAFFSRLTALPARTRKRVGDALLRPLRRQRQPRPPAYYAIWILSLFHSARSWDHADALLRIYRDATSPIVRRAAALALATCGSRAHVLPLKEDIHGAPPLLRTAILAASKRLGQDERRFWRQSLRLADPLEKLA